MLHLSELLIQHPELNNFSELEQLVSTHAKATRERFFRIDVKPSFPDTPENWEDRLEAAFY
ncbi:sulfur relay protein DsrC [Thioflexithrix psekupsensis]|uniref:Sulfur relay protein DsrC n=1 Tax=Thioflexithrix psekupsensis TaxID=1570016 RepID=A0A251X527_9GAMM|nr:sulfur relay protein DsrC [Thioflexithrix psekupsensis]OUD12490.1 sulfur relay protein DsrC [Thioflexithrix psekupsensis]